MSYVEDERNQGYWCARYSVKRYGLQATLEFAEDTPDDEPWWQGFKEYLEEVNK